MIELRPYQERDVPQIRAAFSAGARAVLYVAPTGSGKTVLSAFVIANAITRGNRCLFLAGRTELLDQTAAKLRIAGITQYRIIQAERDLGGADAPVTIASQQTLATARWLDRMPAAHLIIQDEAHHSSCDTIARILAQYPTARILGLTATPMRGDRRPLSPPFDTLVVGPSVRELTDLGHLVECKLWAPPKILDSGQLALDPVAAYVQHGNGEPAVVFCASIEHAKRVAADFNAHGIPSAHIDGQMSAGRRKEILARLASGDIRVMSSVDVVTEGFDLPALSVAIMARKFGHVGRWLQAIGRVLRPSRETGKTIARVIDLVGSAHDHGPPDLAREYSLDGAGIAPMVRTAFRQCAGCGAMYVAATSCPHCGEVAPVHLQAGPRVTGVGVAEIPARPAPRREFIVTIKSKYRGTCVACGQPFASGDLVLWATLAHVARHPRCPTAQAVTA